LPDGGGLPKPEKGINCGRWELPEEDGSTAWITEETLDWLQKREQEDRPWFAMVNMINAQFGRILNHLKQSGQFENTLIVFVSDHGEYLGCHGVWEKGLFAYEKNNNEQKRKRPSLRKTRPTQAQGAQLQLLDDATLS